MTEKQQNDPNFTGNNIEPGMLVEATEGDFGDHDISKPKVANVVRDEKGNVEEVIVEKGLLFKKHIEIPADRILQVEPASQDGANGEILIDADEDELESLHPVGEEQLSSEEEHKQNRDKQGVLGDVEQAIPTAQGLSQMEADNAQRQNVLSDVEQAIPTAQGLRRLEADNAPGTRPLQGSVIRTRQPGGFASWLRYLGPGFLGGISGNDPSAVTAYAIDGAQAGYGHLWLILLTTPLYQSVLFTCAKVGRITQDGFAEVLRKHYGRWVAVLAACVLVLSNIALITADLAAIGSGLQLITGINWIWFVVPVAAALWYLTVFNNFESIKKIFILLSLIFVAYIATGILARPNWGAILFHTFVPQISFDFASISSVVALLGATISPYSMFWQMRGEKEEKRPGPLKQQLRIAALDIGSGAVSGNLIAYFIILSTATTLFSQHKALNTAADAAQALVPVLGPFAADLFALGLIGSGLIAVPILLASTSYAVSGTFGWPAGLSKQPWQSEGFYLILTAALAVSITMALLRLDPIKLIFWANVLAGVLAPILVVYLIVVGNNRKIMKNSRLGILTNIGLLVTALVLVTATVLFFYGLATGQGS